MVFEAVTFFTALLQRTDANKMTSSFFSVKQETAFFIASIFLFLSLSRQRHQNILFFCLLFYSFLTNF